MIKPLNQGGLSMIELLVALALSSFLVLGVTQIYVDNKKNYLFQQGQIGNLENGRFALMTFEDHLAKAGYRRRPDQDMEQAFPAGTFNAGAQTCTFTAGEAVTRVSATAFCLRYQPRDENEEDCRGTSLAASWSSTELASIEKPYTVPQSSTAAAGAIVERMEVANGQLTCNGEVLVDGVADVVFGYGVGPSSERLVAEYTAAPTTPIRSVRYDLLMSSENSNLSDGMTSKAYCDWNNIAPCTPAPDNTLYQVVSSGITIRNLMP
ncbi:MAG: PilW family protein [Halopseudomonas sp.]|uniref:PilW family protein n=1 Tax=Halopseudomonas sp. TaxID=2901191 RepID=UPI003001652A